MSHTHSLARAGSTTPLPSTFALPEAFLSSMTDEVAALLDVQNSYDLVEALLQVPAFRGDRPPVTSLGSLLRILNAELTVRVKAVEGLLMNP